MWHPAELLLRNAGACTRCRRNGDAAVASEARVCCKDTRGAFKSAEVAFWFAPFRSAWKESPRIQSKCSHHLPSGVGISKDGESQDLP